MGHNRIALWLGLAGLAAALVAASPASASEGFGTFTKKTARMTRVSPPAVFLTGNRIAVKTSGTDAACAAVAQRLQTQLESQLISHDQRFVTDAAHPEVVIEVKVNQNHQAERWEGRQETQTRKAGTDAKGRDRYESYSVEVNYKVVSHSLRATYKATDAAHGKSLDADSIAVDFEQAFRGGEGAPDPARLETSAIDDAVGRITRRLTPSREQIEVLLPQGGLEGPAALAQAGLWNRYLEAIEKHQPFAKPADEAYRQYALGTAYEALGYAADDPGTTLKYLEKADSYFNSALEANPGEKVFSQPYKGLLSSHSLPPPPERVQAALVGYRRLLDFRDGLASAPAGEEAVRGGKSLERASGSAGSAEPMNNAAVIRMVQAGLGQDIVLKAIDSATLCTFDVSADGLIALSQAKVETAVIRRMQEAGGSCARRQEVKKGPARPKRPSGG